MMLLAVNLFVSGDMKTLALASGKGNCLMSLNRHPEDRRTFEDFRNQSSIKLFLASVPCRANNS